MLPFRLVYHDGYYLESGRPRLSRREVRTAAGKATRLRAGYRGGFRPSLPRRRRRPRPGARPPVDQAPEHRHLELRGYPEAGDSLLPPDGQGFPSRRRRDHPGLPPGAARRHRASTSAAVSTTRFATTARASAPSTTSPWPSGACSAPAASTGSWWWTATSTKATAPRPSSPGTARSSLSPSTRPTTTPPQKPPSDIDIDLADQTGDEEYLELLRERYVPALLAHRPNLVVYLAGADPYYQDQLGGLALTMGGLRQRDRFVMRDGPAGRRARGRHAGRRLCLPG